VIRAPITRAWRHAWLLALLYLLPSPVPAQATRFGLEHYERLVRLAEPVFSPDGRALLVTVRRPDFAANRWTSQIQRIDAATGAATPVTVEGANARSPRWSPTGDRVAFLAAVDGQTQLFVQPADGGAARQVTRSPTGVNSYAWSRDGRRFAYTAPDEPPGREPHEDAFYADANDYLARSAPMPLHAWTVPVDGGAARRLTSGAWSINRFAPALDWRPDDARIAFTTQPSAGSRDMHRRAVGTVSTAGVGTGDVEDVIAAYCTQQGYSADGAWIALSCPRNGELRNQNELLAIASDGGAIRPLSRALDRNFGRARWTPDGGALVATAPDAGGTGLWTFPLEGRPRRWTLGDIYTTGDLDMAADGRVAFIGKTPERPDEIYVVANATHPPVRLTDFQHALANVRFGRTETLTWTSEGLPFSGVVTYPPDFDPKRRYPLVLMIHGGPWFSSRAAFVERTQLMAAQGWIVFQPNYRGSDNFGNAAYAAIYRDHGAGPGRDVMAGLETLKARGVVDTARIGVSGWSYGGYMTAWLIGHYPGWKAALAGAAVLDLTDNYALNDLDLTERAYGPSLTLPADRALLAEQSPATYVDAITTPLLLMAVTGDTRVPVTQSYRLFRALKERGRDVQLLLYPVSDHVPDDPVRARDIDRRWVEWFAERLR
jgi:dipeptidyl aminopeptidase/acylaminoacyl peptidase